jgi:hypothetical protein
MVSSSILSLIGFHNPSMPSKDPQFQGALDSTDLAIGMYLIQGLMSGQLLYSHPS